MERKTIEAKNYLIGYHTQEFRIDKEPLDYPIICKHATAWLGRGYYFWTDKEFAMYWGEDFKMKTGGFDVYSAFLNVENCINAVFDEKGYFFFRDCLEKAIQNFESKGLSVTLKAVHEFLAENYWTHLGIEGIIYDDLPMNPSKDRNKARKYSVIEYQENGFTRFLYYKKRIQVVMFDLKNIFRFDLVHQNITGKEK